MATNIIYAFVGGILPALVWLIFWLREDRKSPEPRGLILKTFLLGMGGVLLIALVALIFEKEASRIVDNMALPAIILLASIEEGLKFLAGYFGGIRSVEDNEPVDPLIYMITAALGFVALENTLFILGPMIDGNVLESLVTGHMRFIGASLLHIVSSGFVGMALAFSFYKSLPRKFITTILGLMVAIAFHTFFNIVILTFKGSGATLSAIAVWTGVIFLLWAFERAKAIAR